MFHRPMKDWLIDWFENIDWKLFIAATSHFALIHIQNLQTSLYSLLIFEFWLQMKQMKQIKLFGNMNLKPNLSETGRNHFSIHFDLTKWCISKTNYVCSKPQLYFDYWYPFDHCAKTLLFSVFRLLRSRSSSSCSTYSYLFFV